MAEKLYTGMVGAEEAMSVCEKRLYRLRHIEIQY